MSDFIKLGPLYRDPDDELRVRASAVEAICTTRAADGRQTHVITANNAFSCKETPEEVLLKIAEIENPESGVRCFKKAPFDTESQQPHVWSFMDPEVLPKMSELLVQHLSQPPAAHAACEGTE